MPLSFRRAGALAALAVLLTVPRGPAAAQAPSPSPAVSADASSAPPPPDLPVLRLDDLLASVRSDNPSLRAARLEAEALGRRAPQVAALPDPVVMVAYQPFPLLTARGAQRSQWRVEQQIPYPGKRTLQADVADFSADVAAHEADVYAEDLALGVKRTYYDLVRIQAQTGLVEAFRARLADFEQVAAAQYEVGTGMQQAVLKAQVEKNALTQRLVALARQHRSAVETLARLTDAPIEGEFVVTADPAAPAVADVEVLVDVARRLRPEVEALAAAEARAEAGVALAQKQFRPDFGVNLTYFDIAQRDLMPTATGRDALALGVSVKVPLQRGRLRAGLEEARLRAAQVQARQEALQTQFTTEIADLVSTLEREAEQIDLYARTLIPQAETAREATLAAYTTGRTSFLDLLDAERMLFTLRMSHEDALSRYLQATAALERALGVASLQEADALLLGTDAAPTSDHR